MHRELNSSRIPSTPLEVAVTNVKPLSGYQPSSSTAPRVRTTGFVSLMNCWKQKWIWVLLVAFLAFESYFMRELLAALFLFAVLYVCLVALIALYLLIDHIVCCGVPWTASLVQSLHFWHRHRYAADRGAYNSLPKSRALVSGQELG